MNFRNKYSVKWTGKQHFRTFSVKRSQNSNMSKNFCMSITFTDFLSTLPPRCRKRSCNIFLFLLGCRCVFYKRNKHFLLSPKFFPCYFICLSVCLISKRNGAADFSSLDNQYFEVWKWNLFCSR